MKIGKLNKLIVWMLFGILILSVATVSSGDPIVNPNSMGFSMTTNHVTVGETISVVLWVNVSSEINTVWIENMTYWPAGLLHYDSTEKGDLFVGPGIEVWLTPEDNGIINNDTGYARLIVWSHEVPVNWVVNGKLATITMNAQNTPGTATLNITEGHTYLNGSDPGTTFVPYEIYIHPEKPSSFTATAFDETTINLNWIKDTGMDKTLIRYTIGGGYPTAVDEGIELYFGIDESTDHPGLNPGDTVYYSAWGYDDESGFYSLGYSTAVATTGVPGENLPPYTPSGPSPTNGATGVGINDDLSWTGGDPDPEDIVTYDVYFGTSSNPPKVVSNQSSTSYNPGQLAYSTPYYWKIVAWDNHDASTEGPIWSFTTAAYTPPYNPPYNPPPYNPPSAPTADANGPYYEPLEDGVAEVTFNGTGSSGSITSYSWDFGDNTTGTGVSPTHGYTALGNFTVNLTVTGPGGSDIDQTFAIISEEPNLPPIAPVISGPQAGSKNTDYNYTAVSTDEDNDTLQYIFDWGDGTNSTSDFAANATDVTQMHNWSTWGIYTIKVNASDNKTYSGTTEYVVLIDVLYVKNIGYLIDTNSNGTYDKFYSNETAEQTSVEKLANGSYLINSDTDSEWDWIYDPPADNLSPYVPPSEPEKEEDYTLWYYALMILLIIILLIIAAAMKKKKKPKKKPEKPKK